MESFYINKEKNEVKPELFNKTAEEYAKSFISVQGKYCVSKTQLRRLYDEVKRFEQNLDGTDETWKKNYPYIKMIKSKTSYNIARAIKNSNGREKDVYIKFSSFISDGLDQIKDEQDYHVFTSFFEAVYGFYYKEIIDNNIREGN